MTPMFTDQRDLVYKFFIADSYHHRAAHTLFSQTIPLIDYDESEVEAQLVSFLNDIQRICVVNFYGLMGYSRKTFKEISLKYGISPFKARTHIFRACYFLSTIRFWPWLRLIKNEPFKKRIYICYTARKPHDERKFMVIF